MRLLKRAEGIGEAGAGEGARGLPTLDGDMKAKLTTRYRQHATLQQRWTVSFVELPELEAVGDSKDNAFKALCAEAGHRLGGAWAARYAIDDSARSVDTRR